MTTIEQINAAPVGTVIGNFYIRTVEGWRDSQGSITRPEDVRNWAARNGDPEPVQVEMPQMDVTLQRFQQRLRAFAIGQGYRNSEGTRTREALDDFGLTQEPVRVGTFVDFSDEGLTDLLPGDTLLAWGTPHVERFFGLARWHGGHKVEILGPRQYLRQAWVVGLPDGYSTTPWQAPLPDEALRIAEFKAAAWDFGVERKARYSWCGVFESTMELLGLGTHSRREYEAMAGVTPAPVEVTNPHREGSTYRFLHQREVFDYWAGQQDLTVFRTSGRRGLWYVRNQQARHDEWNGGVTMVNSEGSDQGMSTGPGTEFEVIGRLGQRSIVTHDLMDRLPEGSQVAQNSGGILIIWTKQDGEWVPTTGSGTRGSSERFVTDILVLYRIGTLDVTPGGGF